MQTDSRKADLANGLRIARRRGPLVLLCCILTAVAAFAFSTMQRNEYTANAQVLFRNAQLDQQAAGLPVINNANPQAQTDTNIKLATLPLVAANTATAVGHGFTRSAVASAVNVSQVGDTDLVSVSATSSSPTLAARLANAYAHQVVATSSSQNANYYATALRAANLQYQALTPAQQHGLQGADLKDRLSSLQILSQLQSSDVRVQQPAIPPTAPSSPKVARNTVLGGILGLLLGLGIAFLLHRLDRRIREPHDLEEVYGVPVVGVVPESPALKLPQKNEKTRVAALPHNEAEIFGLLRAHIRYFNVDRELRVIVVVSAAPGDGKTTVARNLAIVTASVGSRVLLVEADLRRPTLARSLGTDQEPGLSEVLLGEQPLELAIQRVDLYDDLHTSHRLDLLVAGRLLPPNPPQVIESRAMQSVLLTAKHSYDLVIVDTPPLALLSDAFPLVSRADGVLVVSRLGHNRRDVASRLRDALNSANAPVIGVVANGLKRSKGSLDGYTYGYDYTAYSANGAEFSRAANGAYLDTDLSSADVAFRASRRR